MNMVLIAVGVITVLVLVAIVFVATRQGKSAKPAREFEQVPPSQGTAASLCQETPTSEPSEQKKATGAAAQPSLESSSEVQQQETVASAEDTGEELIPIGEFDVNPEIFQEQKGAQDTVEAQVVPPQDSKLEQETTGAAAGATGADNTSTVPEATAPEPLTAKEPVAGAPAKTDVITAVQAGDAASTESADKVQLSLAEYSAHLHQEEEKCNAAFSEAVEQKNDQRRDLMHRALVVIYGRLMLLEDSYAETKKQYQEVLDGLIQLRQENGSPELERAISEMQHGKTAEAATFLEALSNQQYPFALRAAFLRGLLADCDVDLQKAMSYYRQAVTGDDKNAEYCRAAGMMARSLYQYDTALPWFKQYVQLEEESGAGELEIALAQRELAWTLLQSGQYKEAGSLYKKAMTTFANKLGPDDPEMATSWEQIGIFQETIGSYENALSLYQKALAILEKNRGREHPALAAVLRQLASLYVELGQDDDAIAAYEQLVHIQEKTVRTSNPQLALSLGSLAEVYCLQARYDQAEECYLKVLRIKEQVCGPEDPAVAAVLLNLSKVCAGQNKTEEAEQYQKRATELFQKSMLQLEETTITGDMCR